MAWKPAASTKAVPADGAQVCGSGAFGTAEGPAQGVGRPSARGILCARGQGTASGAASLASHGAQQIQPAQQQPGMPSAISSPPPQAKQLVLHPG